MPVDAHRVKSPRVACDRSDVVSKILECYWKNVHQEDHSRDLRPPPHAHYRVDIDSFLA